MFHRNIRERAAEHTVPHGIETLLKLLSVVNVRERTGVALQMHRKAPSQSLTGIFPESTYLQPAKKSRYCITFMHGGSVAPEHLKCGGAGLAEQNGGQGILQV